MTAANGPHIGVFDSGFGGLTVLRALLPLIPDAHYTYLGDTARLPYGAKSQATIARYAVESARFLEAQGAHLLVIACNTATALALPEISAAVRIPVVGVIEPVVQAASCGARDAERTADRGFSSGMNSITAGALEPHEAKQVLVLATAATIQSHAYHRACEHHGLEAFEKACPLLVPLVEEGWTDNSVTDEVLRIYLSEALAHCRPDAVLLGCTHYPLIADPIKATLRALGSQALVIDSAKATAQATAAILGIHSLGIDHSLSTSFRCFATDSVEKFERLGSLFLQRPLGAVQLLDLGG